MSVRRARYRVCTAGPAVLLALALVACNRSGEPPAALPAGYVPGLGEIMTLQQMRHTKLWLAGQAGNWELASYELDELGEGFDDVVRFHPTHKDAPLAPRDLIPRMVVGPLSRVRAAVERKDSATFAESYDALTASCNSCHSAMNIGFNVVVRPTGNPYANEVFEASH